MTTRSNQIATKGSIPSKDRSRFSQERYKFLLESPYPVSSMCCQVMKKNPSHEYAKRTGRKPMTAQTASESRLRTQQWLTNGCNGFTMKSPISNPMAFWTEQDVLLYIKKNNLPICSVYGEIVVDNDRTNQIEGQYSMFDWEKTAKESELFDLERPLLKTTGCSRTGCMFCGYGAHCKDDHRFEMLKVTHPKYYDYIMRPCETEKEVTDPVTGKKKTVKLYGLNYKAVIDWINEHGNLNIKY